MIIDKQAELVLKQIIQLNKPDIVVDSSFSEQRVFDSLKEKGLITVVDASSLSGFSYIVNLTQEGFNYFDQKKQILKTVRKENLKYWVCYSITTLIAIAALIVGIISLNR